MTLSAMTACLSWLAHPVSVAGLFLLLVPVGVFATVATTARPDPVSVTWAGEIEGRPAVGYNEAGQWTNIGVSGDGGRTFVELPRPASGAQWSVTPRMESCAGRH